MEVVQEGIDRFGGAEASGAGSRIRHPHREWALCLKEALTTASSRERNSSSAIVCGCWSPDCSGRCSDRDGRKLCISMMARINNAQARVLTTVLNDGRLNRLLEGEAVASATDRPAVYRLAGLLDDLRRGIWSEVYADRSIDAGAA